MVENFFTLGAPYHELALYYRVRPAGPLPREETFFGRLEDRDPPLVFRWMEVERLAQASL